MRLKYDLSLTAVLVSSMIAGSGVATASQVTSVTTTDRDAPTISPATRQVPSDQGSRTRDGARPVEIGVHDQLIKGGDTFNQLTNTVITIDRVRLARSGRISIKAADLYGNPSSQHPLGEADLSPGVHKNVKIKLNPELLQKNGYFQTGQDKKAFVTVHSKHGQKTKTIQLFNPSPIQN